MGSHRVGHDLAAAKCMQNYDIEREQGTTRELQIIHWVLSAEG